MLHLVCWLVIVLCEVRPEIPDTLFEMEINAHKFRVRAGENPWLVAEQFAQSAGWPLHDTVPLITSFFNKISPSDVARPGTQTGDSLRVFLLTPYPSAVQYSSKVPLSYQCISEQPGEVMVTVTLDDVLVFRRTGTSAQTYVNIETGFHRLCVFAKHGEFNASACAVFQVISQVAPTEVEEATRALLTVSQGGWWLGRDLCPSVNIAVTRRPDCAFRPWAGSPLIWNPPATSVWLAPFESTGLDATDKGWIVGRVLSHVMDADAAVVLGPGSGLLAVALGAAAVHVAVAEMRESEILSLRASLCLNSIYEGFGGVTVFECALDAGWTSEPEPPGPPWGGGREMWSSDSDAGFVSSAGVGGGRGWSGGDCGESVNVDDFVVRRRMATWPSIVALSSASSGRLSAIVTGSVSLLSSRFSPRIVLVSGPSGWWSHDHGEGEGAKRVVSGLIQGGQYVIDAQWEADGAQGVLLVRVADTLEATVWEDVQDSHKGEQCVLLGNGPSLLRMEPALWRHLDNFTKHGGVVMGVNKFFLGMNTLGFVPTHYASQDHLIVQASLIDILRLPREVVKFINAEFAPAFPPATQTRNMLFTPLRLVEWGQCQDPARWRGRARDVGNTGDDDPDTACFRRKLHKGHNPGCTVTFMALQILHYMGCQRVIIIGMDHTSLRPQGGSATEGAPKEEYHFVLDYIKPGEQYFPLNLAGGELFYRVARRAYQDSGGEVIDATLDGQCDIFRKQDYLDVFGLGNIKKD